MTSEILRNLYLRNEMFSPNRNLDNLISEISRLVSPIQEAVNKEYNVPQLPVYIIVGCPRAGTTLISQLLASTSLFAFPTNLLSRFASSPYLGSLVSQMILDPRYQLITEQHSCSDLDLTSNIGKTLGLAGINEFFHFWRRFFPNHDPGFLTTDDLELVDIYRMRSELASIQSVFAKPFLSKGMMLQFNLNFFCSHMPELRIIHITRNPIFLMQSVYLARKQYYQSDTAWWSVKPRHFSYLMNQDFIAQVSGQVAFTDLEIELASAKLSAHSYFRLSYEDLCARPRECIQNLALHFDLHDITNSLDCIGSSYIPGNTRKIEAHILDRLADQYTNMKNYFLGNNE